MKIIKNNPTLTLNVIKDKIKMPSATFIISPELEFTARELLHHFNNNVFSCYTKKNKKADYKKVTSKQIKEYELFDFNTFVDMKLKNDEWILITETEIYYSKGDNSK